MNNEKLENLLNLALDATSEEREKSLELNVGYDNISRNWEVIAKASGGFDTLLELFPQITVRPLLNGYGILTVPANLLDSLSERPEIEYIEKPKRLFFTVNTGRSASALPLCKPLSSQIQNETTSSALASSSPSSTLALTTHIRISATQTAPPESSNFGIRAWTVFSHKLKSTKPCKLLHPRNVTNLSQAGICPVTAHTLPELPPETDVHQVINTAVLLRRVPF